MNHHRFLPYCLRLLAILQILTGAGALLPASGFAWWHHWLGLGVMPNNPLLLYALRGGAFVQGAIGVLIWIMATDVVRFRPLVVATSIIYLVSGPAFMMIDTAARMPRFWCRFDAVSCFLTGAVLLTLCFAGSRKTATPPERAL